MNFIVSERVLGAQNRKKKIETRASRSEMISREQFTGQVGSSPLNTCVAPDETTLLVSILGFEDLLE